MLENKIDFIVTATVSMANPNGDPLSGNMPRLDYNGYGVISDVCIKRKIRNRLQQMGENIFVQSSDRSDDGKKSLESRFNEKFPSSKNESDDFIAKEASDTWFDVRAFGQVITFQKKSIGIRGPVSISMAKSVSPVTVETMQITRSVNGVEKDSKASDTMGTKHFITNATYVIKGSINAYFAEKTGFSNDDAEKIKEALRTLFVDDASSARPDGSMEVKEVFWFKHNCKIGNVSSAKIFELLEYSTENDESYEALNIHINKEKLGEYEKEGVQLTIIKGM